MSKRTNLSGGAKWEDTVGYSRAVLISDQLEISGTVAADEDTGIEGDFYGQTLSVLRKLSAVLDQAGFSLGDVIRTRMYVTDIRRWKEVGKAHGEYFRDIKPATTMVEVKALIEARYLVEIEVTARKSS